MTTTPETITSEIQKLEPSAIIELYELDATALGGDILRFHAGTNNLNQNIVWNAQEYTRYPIVASGFEYAGTGSLPRPKVQVSNFLSGITTLTMAFNDLMGAKFTRRRTLRMYLDAVNFAGGNPSADPDAAFPDEIFYVDRKSLENRDGVEFELACSFDLVGVQLPRRQVIQNICVWKYRGGECGYTGTNYFTGGDVATSDASADTCGKRLSSCKKRFGQTSVLPFGGFPGADLYK
ncbi:MAG: phage minor tail protein L [Bdellovibrionales bacterium]